MEPAWAKLNLSLDVLGARPDGFHDLRMVMQSVDLHDDVTVTLDDTGTCRAETNRSYLPCGADNVAVRAAQVFLARAGLTCGVHIRLHKRIPVCAGLGGGSSDAAAVLRALERLTGAGFTRTQLEEMGAEIGSDVPYCVAGGTVLAEGRGERLTPVTPMPRLPVVICKPDFPISTPELFHRVDARTSRCRPDTEGICAALADGDMPRLARRMYNVFEDVLTHREGEIAAIKSRLRRARRGHERHGLGRVRPLRRCRQRGVCQAPARARLSRVLPDRDHRPPGDLSARRIKTEQNCRY